VVFICVLKLGIEGAALTSLLSQTVAALLTIRNLFYLPEQYKLRLKQIRLELKLLGEILNIGVPAAVQAIALSLSNMFVQTSINRLGVSSMAAFTAYYKAENLIYFPIMATGQACSNFVSQNVGAGKLDRAKQGTTESILIGVATTLTLSALSVIFAASIFSLFNKDPEVIYLGCKIARTAFPFYFIYVFLEVYAASIRGAGNALATMVITLFNMCVVRLVVLKLLVSLSPTVVGIAAVYPITWACSAACMFIYYKVWSKKALEPSIAQF
jgi:Na+-driven multidrug efflux pump